jgi:hypothetical protein
MNGYNHPAPLGFVVVQKGCLDSLRLEGNGLLAVDTLYEFTWARKWLGDRIIAKRAQHILLAWHCFFLRSIGLRHVAGILEGSMIAEVRSGQREFEPDPVPAVCSVREYLP